MAEQGSIQRPEPLVAARHVAGAALIGFGVMVLLLSSAYAEDQEALRRVPETVWLFVCGGLPASDPTLTLPLLIGGGALALLLGAGLLLGGRLVRRREARRG